MAVAFDPGGGGLPWLSNFPMMVGFLLIESRHSWKSTAEEVGANSKITAMTNSLTGSESYMSGEPRLKSDWKPLTHEDFYMGCSFSKVPIHAYIAACPTSESHSVCCATICIAIFQRQQDRSRFSTHIRSKCS
jgi:hypothetical protein